MIIPPLFNSYNMHIYIYYIYMWDYMGKGFGKGYSDGTQGVRMMRTYERKVPDTTN